MIGQNPATNQSTTKNISTMASASNGPNASTSKCNNTELTLGMDTGSNCYWARNGMLRCAAMKDVTDRQELTRMKHATDSVTEKCAGEGCDNLMHLECIVTFMEGMEKKTDVFCPECLPPDDSESVSFKYTPPKPHTCETVSVLST
jgi:hypothetical protein